MLGSYKFQAMDSPSLEGLFYGDKLVIRQWLSLHDPQHECILSKVSEVLYLTRQVTGGIGHPALLGYAFFQFLLMFSHDTYSFDCESRARPTRLPEA